MKDFASVADGKKPEKLVDAPTPTDAQPSRNKLVDVPTPVSAATEKREFPKSGLSRVSTADDMDDKAKSPAKENGDVKGLGVNGIEDDMKTVAI